MSYIRRPKTAEQSHVRRLLAADAARSATAETGAPTPEMEAQVEAVQRPTVDRGHRRENWQIVTRLMKLRDDGLISLAAYNAGVRWRDAWDIGVEGVRNRDGNPEARGSSPSFGVADHRLDALAAIRAARVAVGEAGHAALIWCVAHDRPWPDAARMMGASDYRTAIRRAVAALDALLGHYDAADRAGKGGRPRNV